MATYCEDYPCCGHTDGLGCDWSYSDDQRAYDYRHGLCDHEAGICEYFDATCDEDHRCPDCEECVDACRCEDRDDDPLYDDWYSEALNREAQEESLGRPLFPNEY